MNDRNYYNMTIDEGNNIVFVISGIDSYFNAVKTYRGEALIRNDELCVGKSSQSLLTKKRKDLSKSYINIFQYPAHPTFIDTVNEIIYDTNDWHIILSGLSFDTSGDLNFYKEGN